MVASVEKNITSRPVKLAEIMRWLGFIVVIAIIIVGTILIWRHHQRSAGYVNGLATPQQVEKLSSELTDTYLKQGNYQQYQLAEINLADLYLGNYDTAGAQRVMDQVFKNVPNDKIISDTYAAMVGLEQAKKDTVAAKRYLQLEINASKKEGNTKLTEVLQKALDSQ